jgi:hypothetical protein
MNNIPVIGSFPQAVGSAAKLIPDRRALALQFSFKVLGFATADAPVGFCICDERDHDVIGGDPASTLDLFAQRFVKSLLEFVGSVDARNSNQHDLVASLNSETRVLDDQFVRGVLMYDLVAVTRRDSQRLDHGIVRGVEQPGDGFLIPSLD